ncbi:MAG: Holliday junction branch migration protein RuvA [Cytophagaceae bacterium]|jgi:Holliday junction DNA helicase RuvA|nr:Holliday junction branch migration protein RuvA [Cytophagaceae bacterium]
MFAYIEGELAHLDPTYAVLDNHGIGYHLRISLNTFAALKELKGVCKLYTFLHIKEDAHTLFGFFDMVEKRVFQDLLSVSGVGPSTAVMMLSSLSAQEVQQAIAQEDIRTVQSIKGIGAKTAQRLILELKEKMRKALISNDVPILGASHNLKKQEALTALVTLGIPKSSAEKNLEIIIKKNGEEISLEELIRQALKMA